MTEPGNKYWSDVLSAITEIDEFVSGIASLNEYVRDVRTKRAVERNLSIIGEAMGQIRKLIPGEAFPDANAIVGMRNRLIHAYDNVDDRIVWEVIRKDLPKLKAEAERRLRDRLG